MTREQALEQAKQLERQIAEFWANARAEAAAQVEKAYALGADVTPEALDELRAVMRKAKDGIDAMLNQELIPVPPGARADLLAPIAANIAAAKRLHDMLGEHLRLSYEIYDPGD